MQSAAHLALVAVDDRAAQGDEQALPGYEGAVRGRRETLLEGAAVGADQEVSISF